MFKDIISREDIIQYRYADFRDLFTVSETWHKLVCWCKMAASEWKEETSDGRTRTNSIYLYYIIHQGLLCSIIFLAEK